MYITLTILKVTSTRCSHDLLNKKLFNNKINVRVYQGIVLFKIKIINFDHRMKKECIEQTGLDVPPTKVAILSR